MNYLLLFSPTGGTAAAAEALCSAWDGPWETLDLTDRSAGFRRSFAPEDLVLAAVPSFGGRVPALAGARLAQMEGNGASAVLLCVYGNRAFEDTLVELEDLLTSAGFRCRAAAAAVARHSIVPQIAAGRPDGADRAQLQDFGRRICSALSGAAEATPSLPGNRPYKERGGGGMVPQAGEACVRCGACARRCPAGAIDSADPSQTDADKCISCMRCVALCPRHARQLPAPKLAAVTQMLSQTAAGRRENELFL